MVIIGQRHGAEEGGVVAPDDVVCGEVPLGREDADLGFAARPAPCRSAARRGRTEVAAGVGAGQADRPRRCNPVPVHATRRARSIPFSRSSSVSKSVKWLMRRDGRVICRSRSVGRAKAVQTVGRGWRSGVLDRVGECKRPCRAKNLPI
jgi:hypothetical protein